MAYKYLRFQPNTGPFRSNEVNKMKELGVAKLSRAFEESSHPDRSALYVIEMKPGLSLDLLNEYFENNDIVLAIDDETYEKYANAPDERSKDKHGRFIIE